jgi:ATPase subunit of ABC transporter with duplicated ATPase domains
MLTRIFADNFRALVNFELRPARLTLLLGDNGSGKTSILDVMGNLRDLIVLGRTSTELFSYTRTKWETRDTQRFELEFQTGDGLYRYALEIQHLQGVQERPFIRSENVSFGGEPLYHYSEGEVRLHYDDATGTVFPYRSDQSFLANLDSARSPRMTLLGEFKELVAGLWIIQPNPFAMEPVSKQDQSFLMRNGMNFASFFEHLNAERPDVRVALEEHLREALPGFRNFRFTRLWDSRLLLATFGEEKHKAEYGLGELSEGQRVHLVLYAAVFGHLRRGSLLCFDEPDNFVSLPEIQPWLQTLRDVIEEQQGQALVISHNPEVIDYLALDSILRFERPSGPVIVRPLEIKEESDLRLSDLIARGA